MSLRPTAVLAALSFAGAGAPGAGRDALGSHSRPRVLVLVVGLPRTFESTGPALVADVVTPNSAVYVFELAASMELSSCSDKDYSWTGCCVEGQERTFTERELRRRVERAYAPVPLRHFIVSDRARGMESRVRLVLERVDVGDYAAVFLTRPDAALTGASNAGVIAPAALPMRVRLSEPLDLARACSERPGLSIITGSSRHENNAGRLLDRDHDYMILACTPAALLLMLFETRPGQTSCIHHVLPAPAWPHSAPHSLLVLVPPSISIPRPRTTTDASAITSAELQGHQRNQHLDDRTQPRAMRARADRHGRSPPELIPRATRGGAAPARLWPRRLVGRGPQSIRARPAAARHF